MEPQSGAPDVDEVDETDANNRVHHHAWVDGGRPQSDDGTFDTMCGLRIKRRPDAAELPCCPMCALTMGGPCR